jgi:hypothetical protein
MTEPTDYYGIRIGPGENLAARFPQVAVRARMYRLEDDGASDLARRKRAAKGRDIIAQHQKAIAAIEKRQAGDTFLDPYPPEIAAKRIEAHRAAIRRQEAGLNDVPAVNVVAPVARRVAREDRRRTKKPSQPRES